MNVLREIPLHFFLEHADFPSVGAFCLWRQISDISLFGAARACPTATRQDQQTHQTKPTYFIY